MKTFIVSSLEPEVRDVQANGYSLDQALQIVKVKRIKEHAVKGGELTSVTVGLLEVVEVLLTQKQE